MLTIQVHGHTPQSVTYFGNQLLLDGNPIDISFMRPHERFWNIVLHGKLIPVIVVGYDAETHVLDMRVNGKRTHVTLTSRADSLRKVIGADLKANRFLADLKAPMPGLIKALYIEAGATLKKGDPILVLEAMKMENVLKAAADTVVKEVVVEAGNAVEKGQVLIRFA